MKGKIALFLDPRTMLKMISPLGLVSYGVIIFVFQQKSPPPHKSLSNGARVESTSTRAKEGVNQIAL